MLELNLETITPELATQYLSRNTKNRSIRKADVAAYARAIKRGEFVVTHQGIAFDDEGNLIDGQHRLMAIAMAGIPVQMYVAKGIASKSISVIDRGSSRTMRDVMTLSPCEDEERATMMRSTLMLSAMSQMVQCSTGMQKLTSDEMTKLFDAFSEAATVAYHNGVTNKAVGRSQVVSAAIAAVYCGVSKEDIERFFRVFNKADIHNCDGRNVQVVLNWRRQIDNAKVQGTPMNRYKVYYGTQAAIWNFVNNTGTSRLVVTNRPKYDVSSALKEVLAV